MKTDNKYLEMGYDSSNGFHSITNPTWEEINKQVLMLDNISRTSVTLYRYPISLLIKPCSNGHLYVLGQIGSFRTPDYRSGDLEAISKTSSKIIVECGDNFDPYAEYKTAPIDIVVEIIKQFVFVNKITIPQGYKWTGSFD